MAPNNSIRRAARLLPVLLPLLLFITTGLRGIDFGYHWDEQGHQIDPARVMIKSGVLLPREYIYPSFNRILTLLPATAAGVQAMRDESKAATVQTSMLKSMDRAAYLFEVRTVYLVTSSLAIVWLYLLILSFRDSVAEAFLGASTLGLSWEFAYHARWIATDCVVAQFGALTILLAMRYRLEPKSRHWLYLSAAAAGLATGTKYPGGILILPVLIAAVQAERGLFRIGRLASRLAKVLTCFLLVYLVTTPGTLLDPWKFFAQLEYARDVYKKGWYGYTVTAGFPHLARNVGYLALNYFSHFTALALLLFLAALFGLYKLARGPVRDSIFVLSAPISYLAYFSFGQGVMIVRNLQLLGPFFALLAARGLLELWRLLRPRALRIAAAAAMAGVLVANGAWLIHSSQTIRRRGKPHYVEQAVAYMHARSGDAFFVSGSVLDAARAAGLSLPPNVVSRASQATHAVLYAAADGPGPKRWKSNDPWQTVAVFGPNEVNFKYYASWKGDDRVLVMTTAKARQMEVPGMQ